ncbi:toxin-antitoxin system YwqK family antitoxin [Ekhidna sp. To15]|uniref:toxin-antitoxin system YwqK family antitoxin n=1 Tax=Ekhidna sp. To15 TaxID=3395267 RepID=UPI003F524965
MDIKISYIILSLVFISCGKNTKETHYSNGSTREVVDLLDEMRHGDYYAYHQNGNLWKRGTFVNDTLEGKMSIYYSNGKLMLERNYVKGKIEGRQISYWQNGKFNEILHFENDKPHGDYFYLDSLNGDTIAFMNYFQDSIRYKKVFTFSGNFQEHYMYYDVNYDSTSEGNTQICFEIFSPVDIGLRLEIGEFNDDYMITKNYDLISTIFAKNTFGKSICYDLSNHESDYIRGNLLEFNNEGMVLGAVYIDEPIKKSIE